MTPSSKKGTTPVSLDLARWQFGSTSMYHFIFIPVTIGLAFLVALLQTAWYRNGDDTYRRLARFFGALLLINVAVGVVSGLIQEFEFGMNWSAYSRLVGNVFGGPLAMEGLAAFFLESTFLGLWIFGWNRLSKKAHLACIWLVASATMLSAAFIMAANSWMQHPVGYTTTTAPTAAAQQHLGAVHQPRVPVGLRPRPPGLAGHRGGDDAGGLCLAPAQEPPGRVLPPDRRHLARGPAPVGGARPLRGQRAGRGGGDLPADEDRRRRGALGHLPRATAPSRSPRSGAGKTTRRRPRSSRSPTSCRSWPPTTSTARCRA